MIPLHDDNPTTIKPIVTISLIIACVLVFFYQLSLPASGERIFVYQFGAIPAVLFGTDSVSSRHAIIPAPLSLISSMFLHGGWMHLIGNMLYLWIFSNNIEDAMGHRRFIAFYTLCGVIAALSHALTAPGSSIPMVGASGAISGVLGAYLLLYPRASVLVVIPIWVFLKFIRVPAALVLGFWFLLQLFSGSASLSGDGGGVAWFAHIGGFIAGMVLIGFFKRPGVRFFNPPRRHSRGYGW
jgi:membrane associated rhomboid family serine protease